MNIDFKVLWIEDTRGWFLPAQRRLTTFIDEHQFIPSILNRRGDENDLETLLYDDYDLILMDYRLIQITGDEFIRRLRNNQIYTDVLFYSAQYDEMLRSIYQGIKGEDQIQPPFDGVYYSDRKDTEFYPKLHSIIDKLVKRVQDVVNLRGVVLDNVSGFENDINHILTLSWLVLGNEEKDRIRKYVANDVITESRDNYSSKLQEMLDSPCCFCATIASKDYLIDSKRKAGILGRIINELRKHHGLIVDDKYSRFSSYYYSEIIQYRNALGHARRNVNGGKDVYVGEINGSAIEFNESLCKQLRQSIQEYMSLFHRITDYLLEKSDS